MNARLLLAIALAAALRAEAATLTGTVTVLGSGAPLGGVTVEVKLKNTVLKQARTNADGTYTLEGLPATNLTVEYQLDGYQDHPVKRPIKPTRAKPLVEHVRMIPEDESDAYYATVAEVIAEEHYNPELVRAARKLAAEKLALVEKQWARLHPPQVNPAPANAAPDSSDPIIITAGTVRVRKSEFEIALRTATAQKTMGGPIDKRSFADAYLKMKLLAQQGREAGVDQDPEVQLQLALLRENVVASAQLARVEHSIEVSNTDLLAAYRTHREYDQVTARHILIAFAGSLAEVDGKPRLTEEQAREKATTLRQRILAGEDFAKLAKEESDDTGSGTRGGELGTFGRGQMVPEFEEVAFATKPGEVSPVFRTQFGYHIVKVEARTMKTLDDVKPVLEAEVRQQKLRAFLASINDHVTYDAVYFPKSQTDGGLPAEAKKPH